MFQVKLICKYFTVIYLWLFILNHLRFRRKHLIERYRKYLEYFFIYYSENCLKIISIFAIFLMLFVMKKIISRRMVEKKLAMIKFNLRTTYRLNLKIWRIFDPFFSTCIEWIFFVIISLEIIWKVGYSPTLQIRNCSR